MQIAVFGGSFNPPHVGHAQIAQALLAQKLADEVWFIPVGQHPLNKSIHDTQHRIKMLQLLLSDQPQMKVDLYETETQGVSYTWKTMCAFQLKYPQHSFSFILGSDNLVNFHKWYEYQALANGFPIYVYPRSGYPLEPLYSQMIPLKNAPIVTTSSSEIRELLKHGKEITQLVDPRIERYIKKNSLYAAQS